MKKFRFSLQAVHDLRMLRQDEAERELAHAARSVHEAQAQLERDAQLRERAIDKYAATLRSQALDPHDAILRTNYLRILTQQETEQRARVLKLEQSLEAKRETLTGAVREAEATASLREQHRSLHAAEAARNEQNALDEMASVSVARRRLMNL